MEHISLISRAEGGSISPNMAVSIYQTGDPEDDNIKTQSEHHVPYQRRNISTTRGNAVTSPNSMYRIRDARYQQLVVTLLPVRTACAVTPSILLSRHRYLFTCSVQPAQYVAVHKSCLFKSQLDYVVRWDIIK